MENIPKISVIITIFNSEKYLEKCLDSLINQKFQNFEIICVDDGSSDNSMSILKHYQIMDNRIKIISLTHKNAGVARNAGMKIATGEFILFLDSDDYFELNMLQEMYNQAKDNKSDIVICEYKQINTNIEKYFIIERGYIPPKATFSPMELVECAIFQFVNGVAWNKLFRRDFIFDLNIQFQDLRCSNDGYFVFVAIANSNRISYIPKQLVNYRMNNYTSLSSTREKSWICAFEMLSAIRKDLIEKDLFNIYRKSYLNYALTHIIGYLASIDTYEIYKMCYQYIAVYDKKKLNLIKYTEDYFYHKEFYATYKAICEMPFEDFIKSRSKFADALGPCVYFSLFEYKPHSKLVIYGAGNYGQRIYNYFKERYLDFDIWLVDKNWEELRKMGLEVYAPQELCHMEIDYILIAVKNYEISLNIRKTIEGYNLKNVIIYDMHS